MTVATAAASQLPLTTPDVLGQAFPCISASTPTRPASREFLIIPQNLEPRWILPRNARRTLPLLRSWSPFSLGARVKWNGIRLAASAGLLHLVPGVLHCHQEITSEYWRDRLPGFDETWYPALLVGNPSHTRKAILFFLDHASNVRAVCKVPLCDEARHAILNEASILRALHGKSPVPVMLLADSEHGITAQTWLPGKPVTRTLAQPHIDLLSSLAEDGALTRLSDHRQPLASQVAQLDLPLDRATLQSALALLEDDTPLPSFLEHRDFVPWNLRRLPDGRVALLDWEWAVPRSLPFQDICRYFYVQDLYFEDFGDVFTILRTHPLLARYVQRFSIQPTLIPALTIHYLLRNLCLNWSNGETRAAQYNARQIEKVLCQMPKNGPAGP